jgi:DNA-binding transcriptional MerR regulator
VVDSLVPEEAKEHFDVDHAFIAHLNGECLDWAGMDGEALQNALEKQGPEWHSLVKERCPHLFAAAPVFISELQLQQMRTVIDAVEEVVGAPEPHKALGMFYGYDFHLNEQGAHLIEVNTNAGGGFLNALLIDSQSESHKYGVPVAEDNLKQVFIEMFLNEWRLEHGDAPLKTIAIVDEQPESQYLLPEFQLAKSMLESTGIAVYIADPSALEARDDGLYCSGVRVDLIYNRLTDFDLQQFPELRAAWEKEQVVLTPNPEHYRRYADKRKLALLSDADELRILGVSQASINALLQCVPQTKPVRAKESERWWVERKQWFFKPVSGYGGKGAYRGEKLTKRVFEEIMQSEYVAQRLAVPGERKVCLEGVEPQSLKYDVRCYVYGGLVQLVAARLYQGQTTNFRTLGGGFAMVQVVE